VSSTHERLESDARKLPPKTRKRHEPSLVAVIAVSSLLLGVSIGFAAKYQGAGIEVIRNKPDKDAALAALAEAEHVANGGSWELIAVGRVYYLSGDKAEARLYSTTPPAANPTAPITKELPKSMQNPVKTRGRRAVTRRCWRSIPRMTRARRWSVLVHPHR